MIKNNNKSVDSSSLAAASVIAESFQIEGIIKTDVSIAINGKVEGEIISNSVILVGDKAVINANISCSEIIISGTVNGNVTAKKRIVIKSKGKLIGEIKTNSFVIEDGGTFLGTSDMNMNSTTNNDEGNNSVINYGSSNNKDYDKNNDDTNEENNNNEGNNFEDNDIESNSDDGNNKDTKKGKPWWQKV